MLSGNRRALREARSWSCFEGLLAAIFIPTGIIVTAVGVPLIVVGARRLRAYKAWQRERKVSLRPHLGRNHATWTPGFELRF